MSKHRERARELNCKLITMDFPEFRPEKISELIQECIGLYEQALSEQRGEIIDEVKTIAKKHFANTNTRDEFIQAIEKLRR
jgi:hypothetical protein